MATVTSRNGVELEQLHGTTRADEGDATGVQRYPGPLLGALAERDPEQFEELCEFVQDASPVRDVLANSVPVSTTLEVLR